MNFREQLLANLAAGPAFRQHAPESVASRDGLRLIAYYLPQYHPIPENDAWWGKGFTEWTNVSKAVPRFVGHYQPHLPGELGFYDLRLPDVLRRQAELARHSGISGFCFHYYWFGGRRLLERPLANLLAHRDIDIGFCINWANESWTRTWDGEEKNVLMPQSHSAEDDVAFARALEPVVRDPRYIRINGRPVVMLYRPGLLPDARATVGRWRDCFGQMGLGDPYLVMPQCFGDNDPRCYGFDAAAEFPPHKIGWTLPDLAYRCKPFMKDFAGRISSYDQLACVAMQEEEPPFRLFRGVCPQWDNDARKPGRGVSFVNATPEKYREWLTWACRQALLAPAPDERIVFINAWNEWAEGTHLEPDRHYGYAYLNATAEAYAAATGQAVGTFTPAIDRGPPRLLAGQMNPKAVVKAGLKRVRATLLGERPGPLRRSNRA